jgi:hypothetical protein
MKIPPVEAELFHVDGQADRQTDRRTDMTNLTVASRSFANEFKYYNWPIPQQWLFAPDVWFTIERVTWQCSHV